MAGTQARTARCRCDIFRNSNRARPRQGYISIMAEDNEKRDTAGPPRVPDRRATGGSSRYLRHGDTPLSLAGRVLRSRWRALSDRFSRDFMRRTLRIGVSARIYHPTPGATGLLSRNLQYLEESVAQWVMSRDVLVFMIPNVNTGGLLHPSNI